MTRPKATRPTDGELEILRILWERGPSTVRQVFRTLNEKRAAGYTTVLKLMQIMTEKGALVVDRTVRPQVFKPVETRRQTQRRLVNDLVERAFGGDPGRLILHALSSKKASAQERKQIRELLDRLEEEGEE